MKTRLLTAIALGFALIPTARAQVPGIINYQGRVTTGGTNFDGTGQLKFALVNPGGSQTFWSNDGSGVGGGEPTAAVSIPVTKGLCSVLLGDATVSNMTVIPATVFTNADVLLRIWFNDGVNGSQQLTPDQRIAAVGYAMIAGNVSDGAITAAKIATGAVGSVQLAAGSVTAGKIASNAITAAQIASNTITAANIATGAVGAVQLAKPPRSGTIASSSLTNNFNQASFGVSFSPPFNTTPVITLSFECADSSLSLQSKIFITSKSASGFTAQWTASPPAPIGVATGGSVGAYDSLAIINGNPAISYYDSATSDLKYARARNLNGMTDSSGFGWTTFVTVDTVGDVGGYTSLVAVNTNPAIAYYDATNGDLKYVRGTDTNGAAWGTPVKVDTNGIVGFYISMAVVNTNPAISYYDQTNQRLKYVRATDSNGATWGTPVNVDTNVNVGWDTSLVVVNGNPAISYYDGASADLKFVRATDANGTAWGTPVAVDTNGFVGRYDSMAIVNGNPAISYYEAGNGDLKYVRATDANGTSWGTPVYVDTVGTNGQYTSLAVVDGTPAISYYDVSNFDLKYVRATDSNGVSWATPVTVDSNAGSVGFYTSLKVVNGSPAISYQDFSNADLKYVWQAPLTTPFTIHWIALEP